MLNHPWVSSCIEVQEEAEIPISLAKFHFSLAGYPAEEAVIQDHQPKYRSQPQCEGQQRVFVFTSASKGYWTVKKLVISFCGNKNTSFIFLRCKNKPQCKLVELLQMQTALQGADNNNTEQ